MDKGLSVCIIAKNEEEMLPACLESVKGHADEIIVVDTGSEDATAEIAANFGAKVFQYKWDDDFSAARNFALEKASCGYILSIDADERLENPEVLDKLLREPESNIGGWLVELVSDATNQDGGTDTYTGRLLRLFKNHPEIRFNGIIHEQILEPILKLGLDIKNSPLKFRHLGYSHSVDEMKNKQLRNLRLLEKALENKPDDPYNLYQRSKTNLALGELEKAEEDISKAIELAPDLGAVKPQALNYGGIIAVKRGELDKARERAKESLRLVPKQRFANYILGELYSSQGDFAAAYESYRKLEDASESFDLKSGIVGDYILPLEKLHFKVGKCLIALKMFDNALLEFEKGFKANSKDISCIVGMSNVAFHYKRYEEARGLLLNAAKIDPARKDVRKFLEQVDIAIGKQKQYFESAEKRLDAPLLSLCMIVKNEEKMLPGCLESVKGAVDEIIIVDTGSMDRTKQIAEEYGANVFDFKWIDDFAEARNESLKHCTGQWVLYLDADERLKIKNMNNLRLLLENAPGGIGGFFCTIESRHLQFDGKTELHRGGYPRLFRNYGYPTLHFKGRVHEQITPSIFALDKSIEFTDIVIEHLGYDQSREVMEGKIKRNYRMLLEHVKEEPFNSYAWYQLGQTLAQMRLVDEAEKTIRFALELGNMADSVYASATATMAQLIGNKKNFAESLEWAEKSLEKAPRQMYAANLRAYSLMYLHRFDEAEKAFHELKVRIKEVQGVPRSGFDIEIPEEIIDRGLRELEKLREGNQ